MISITRECEISLTLLSRNCIIVYRINAMRPGVDNAVAISQYGLMRPISVYESERKDMTKTTGGT